MFLKCWSTSDHYIEFLQDGDIEKATEWIFNPPTGTSHMDASQSSSTTVVDAVLPDGDGSKFLIPFPVDLQCAIAPDIIILPVLLLFFKDCARVTFYQN